MNKFNDIIFEQKTVVHCPTEEQAIKLLNYAHSKGYSWNSSRNYLITKWAEYKEDTCYCIYCGTRADVEHYKRYGYNIVKFGEVVFED